MDARAQVEKWGNNWKILVTPIKGCLWFDMGGFPTMKQAIFVGNSIMRKLGWKLIEPWDKN